MERKLLRQRVIEFSISIQKVVKQLEQVNQYVISKQFLRSGTAIGALVFEAEQSETRDDFIHKMKIALKEANETRYWLTLVENLISLDNGIAEDLLIIIKILNKRIVTAKLNRPKKKREKD